MPITSLIRAGKWGLAIVIPGGVMVFLFAETRIHPLVVFLLAFVLCIGLLLLFRLVVIPGSKSERELLSEERLLDETRTLLSRMQSEVHKTGRSKLIELAEQIAESGRDLAKKMQEDDLVTLRIPSRINEQLIRSYESLEECNSLVNIAPEEVDRRLSRMETVSFPRLRGALRTIANEYAEGRLFGVDTRLASMESLLDVFGYPEEGKRE